jgi:hypothetical protein
MSSLTEKTFVLPENTPAKAPLPTFDPSEANYFDMFAPQYYNLDTLQALMREGGGPLLLQVERVAVEYIYNPEHGEDSGDWKPVIYFAGSGPALVVNQTRAKVLMKATGSIHVKDWRSVGWLEVAAAIENGQAQIVIAPARMPSDHNVLGEVPTTEDGHLDVDALNEELFP